MRVVITGGAGFIGSHLCDRYIADGYEVIALDNCITGSADNVAHLAHHPRFHFIQQDVTQPITIEGPVDAVLHFASAASPKSYIDYPIETMMVGSMGTRNTLDLAHAKGARYMLASTSEVYGDPSVHPQPETYWGNVNCIGVRSVYDEAKRFAEALTMAYHRFHHVNTHIVRIFNTYGPRNALDDGRVIPNFVGQAVSGKPLTVYGDGKQTRSFTFVTDLVEGIVRLLNSEEHEPVNLGNPYTEFTMLELAELINRLSNNTAGIVFKNARSSDDPQVRRPDITRAQQVLGWEPVVTFPEGLSLTLDYFSKKMANANANANGNGHGR